MARVLAIHGALEINNFGDVLLGRIFCDFAREAGWSIAAPSAAPEVAAQLGELVSLDYEAADKILYVGGGYFGEPPRSIFGKIRWGQRLIRLHLAATEVARARGIPYGAIGVGAGPISNPLARYTLRKVLNRASCIAVRDDESAAFIRKLGVRQNVVQTADAALTLSGKVLSEKAEQVRQTMLKRAAGRKIAVLHPAMAGRDTIYGKVFDAFATVDFEETFIIAVADQSQTPGARNQSAANEQLVTLLPQAITLPYEDLDTLIGVIAAADCVVTTKLHVGIVAAALERSVLAFSAHTKTSRFYRQIGIPEQCLPLATTELGSMAAALRKLLKTEPKPAPLLEAQVDRSKANQAVLTGFLSE